MYRLITAVCLLISIMGCSTGSSVAGSGYSLKGDSTIIEESLVSGLQVKLVRMSGTETSCSHGKRDHIELNGPIGPDSTYIVAKYLKMTQPCKNSSGTKVSTIVYLNSAGGLVTDGIELGKLFRKKQVSTRLFGNQQCSSSCAFAFLGGFYRTMQHDSSLMFHAPYKTSSLGQEHCASRNQANDLKSYYVEMVGKKIGNTLFDRTMSYCGSKEGWVINSGAAKAYGIVTD
jgi:ATP-dependent protease ClpP protease subunit